MKNTPYHNLLIVADFRNQKYQELDMPIRYATIKNTSGFATTHVVVSVRHPITYQSPHPLPTSQIR